MATTTWLAHFDRFEDSVEARERLVAAGIAPEAVQLDVTQDEAGPVEGNFLVGNGRSTAGAASDPKLIGANGDTWAPYGPNFERPVARGVHRLLVHLEGERDGWPLPVRALLDGCGARPLG